MTSGTLEFLLSIVLVEIIVDEKIFREDHFLALLGKMYLRSCLLEQRKIEDMEQQICSKILFFIRNFSIGNTVSLLKIS